MKKEFSKKWVSSKQPRKQRKYRYNAPLHLRSKMLSGHLDKKLRKEFGKRALPLRKGDEVVVMRGKFKGIKGKITKVDLKKYKVHVDNAKYKKITGQEIEAPLEPSNLRITDLNMDDRRRKKFMEKKKR